MRKELNKTCQTCQYYVQEEISPDEGICQKDMQHHLTFDVCNNHFKKWSEHRTQNEWRIDLQNLLMFNDKALYSAIRKINDRQTDREKNWGQTIEHNNVGFSASHAVRMQGIISKVTQKKQLDKKELSIARNIMIHYWKQLMDLSITKQSQLKITERSVTNNEFVHSVN